MADSYTVGMRVSVLKELLLDADDLQKYKHLICFVLKKHLHYKYYGVSWEGKRTYLHRLIMQAPDDLVVDHINGNTCDNRKENLRICSNIENTKNLKKQINGLTSKYKGVSFYVRDKTWEVNVAGHYYGRYPTEKLAAAVYNEKAKLLFGEFAKLNVID